MNIDRLYETELWANCCLLYTDLKRLVRRNQDHDDVILRKDLLECGYYLKENLYDAYKYNMNLNYLKNANAFILSLEKSLEMATAKFMLTKKEFYKFMQQTNDIKALFKNLMHTCNPPMK